MALSEYNQECFICRLPDCDTSNKRCGIVRGVKYGLYPSYVINSPSPGLSKKLIGRDTVGFKEIPLFTQADNMTSFCKKVIAYEQA